MSRVSVAVCAALLPVLFLTSAAEAKKAMKRTSPYAAQLLTSGPTVISTVNNPLFVQQLRSAQLACNMRYTLEQAPGALRVTCVDGASSTSSSVSTSSASSSVSTSSSSSVSPSSPSSSSSRSPSSPSSSSVSSASTSSASVSSPSGRSTVIPMTGNWLPLLRNAVSACGGQLFARTETRLMPVNGVMTLSTVVTCAGAASSASSSVSSASSVTSSASSRATSSSSSTSSVRSSSSSSTSQGGATTPPSGAYPSSPTCAVARSTVPTSGPGSRAEPIRYDGVVTCDTNFTCTMYGIGSQRGRFMSGWVDGYSDYAFNPATNRMEPVDQPPCQVTVVEPATPNPHEPNTIFTAIRYNGSARDFDQFQNLTRDVKNVWLWTRDGLRLVRMPLSWDHLNLVP